MKLGSHLNMVEQEGVLIKQPNPRCKVIKAIFTMQQQYVQKT